MMSTRLSVLTLKLTLGLVIAGYSVALLVEQLHGRPHTVLLLLAVAELAAAIVFLIPRTIRLGGMGLIVVFVAAAALHVLHGEYNVANLAIYSAAAWTVVSNEGRA